MLGESAAVSWYVASPPDRNENGCTWLRLGADHRRYRRTTAVRLRLPRTQGAHPHPQGSRPLVGDLRRHRDPLRHRGLDLRRRDDGDRVLRRLRDGEGAVGRQPVRLPRPHDQLQGAPRRPAEGAAVRDRVLPDRPHRVHPPRRRADQLLRLGVLPVRADPAHHRGQPAQTRELRNQVRGQHGRPPRPQAAPHLRALRRRQAVHHRERPPGPDPDAAGHGRHRRHRHPVRARFDSRDLRAHPERLPCGSPPPRSPCSACASCTS